MLRPKEYSLHNNFLIPYLFAHIIYQRTFHILYGSYFFIFLLLLDTIIQAGLEFMAILPQAPESGIIVLYHHTWLSDFTVVYCLVHGLHQPLY